MLSRFFGQERTVASWRNPWGGAPLSKASGQNPPRVGCGWEVGPEQSSKFHVDLTGQVCQAVGVDDEPMDSLPVGPPRGQHFILRHAPVAPGESVILARAAALQRVQELRVQDTIIAAGGVGPGVAGTATSAARTLALSNGHISPHENSPCSVEVFQGAHLMRLRKPGISRPDAPGTRRRRGRVAGYSRRSRARLMERLAQVRTVDVALPMFTSRTFPDRVPCPAEIPVMDDRFWKRFQRRFPEAGVIWHRELMDRKSGETVGEFVPHFHEMVWGVNKYFPFKEEHGEWVCFEAVGNTLRTHLATINDDGRKVWHLQSVVTGLEDSLGEWWRRNWYEIVGSGD